MAKAAVPVAAAVAAELARNPVFGEDTPRRAPGPTAKDSANMHMTNEVVASNKPALDVIAAKLGFRDVFCFRVRCQYH